MSGNLISIKTAGKKKRFCVIQQGRKLISVYQPALKGKFSMNKAERNCTKTVSPQLYGPKKRNATTEHTEHPFCSEPHSSQTLKVEFEGMALKNMV